MNLALLQCFFRKKRADNYSLSAGSLGVSVLRDDYDVFSLGTFLSLGDSKFHFLAFDQGFEA